MKNGDQVETINGMGTIREIRNQGGQTVLLITILFPIWKTRLRRAGATPKGHPITIGRTTDVFTLDEIDPVTGEYYHCSLPPPF